MLRWSPQITPGGPQFLKYEKRFHTAWTQTGHGVTTDKIVSAARPHKSSIRLVEGLRAQRFGLRPRMWSKPCLIAAKRASIIGSNSRSVIRHRMMKRLIKALY